jgi:hypothetical protein
LSRVYMPRANKLTLSAARRFYAQRNREYIPSTALRCRLLSEICTSPGCFLVDVEMEELSRHASRCCPRRPRIAGEAGCAITSWLLEATCIISSPPGIDTDIQSTSPARPSSSRSSSRVSSTSSLTLSTPRSS